ncbi:MAG: TolC family protein [Acidobacteriales bacterium]|nr:TolC family protein [Terriglobales bacterium]
MAAEEKLLRDAVTQYEQAFELNRTRYQGGLASEVDVDQAQTILETTRAQLVDVGVARAQYEHAVAALVGKPPAEFSLTPPPVWQSWRSAQTHHARLAARSWLHRARARPQSRTYLELASMGVYLTAISGSVSAYQELCDRIDGKCSPLQPSSDTADRLDELVKALQAPQEEEGKKQCAKCRRCRDEEDQSQ